MRKIIYIIIVIILFFLTIFLKFKTDNKEGAFTSGVHKWNLMFVTVPTQDKKDILAYGSIFTFRGYTTSLFYFKPENRELRDYPLEWSDNGFKVNDISFYLKEEDELFFRWNENPIGSDRFLDTFSGFEKLGTGVMEFDGSVYDAIVLNEEISADMSKLSSWWREETVVLLRDEFLSLIALKYDGYIDGVLRMNQKEYRVLDVMRFNENINIIFNEGIIRGQCKRYGMYRIIEFSQGSPEEVPISCDLEVLFNNSEKYFFDNIFGQMEII